MTRDAIRWKLRQKYSQFRSLIGGGRHIWLIEPGIRFVARSDDAFSHVLFVVGGHEIAEMRWCRRWLAPGDSAIDCGANIGFFSAYLAQASPVKQIVAVEGNARTAAACVDNLSALGISNVTVVKAVLSASDAEKLVIPDVRGREPWQRATQVEAARSTVPVTTLDLLNQKYQLNPSLIKIDCEGFEPFILKGARRLLQSARAAFMVECNDGALHAAKTSRAELFSTFREFNYSLFHLASFDSSHPFGIICDETFPAREFNFAAIPNNAAALERWHRSAEISSETK